MVTITIEGNRKEVEAIRRLRKATASQEREKR